MVQKINLILFMLKIMFFLFFTIDFVVKYDVGMFFLAGMLLLHNSGLRLCVLSQLFCADNVKPPQLPTFTFQTLLAVSIIVKLIIHTPTLHSVIKINKKHNIACCFSSPHAFIKCIEFVVRQSFLLEYSNNCVVNATLNHTNVKLHLSL